MKAKKRKKKTTKEELLDKKIFGDNDFAPNLDKIVEVVEKSTGVSEDSVLDIMQKGKKNFEEVRADARKRVQGK